MASKKEYDRVPLVSGSLSDSEEDSGPVYNISLRQRRHSRPYHRPFLVAGALVIIVLLAVIAAMCYVIVYRPTPSSTTQPPSVTENVKVTPGVTGGVAPPQGTIVPDTRRQMTSNWNVTFDALGTECVVRLIDIDGDGLQDIVFGAAATADLANIESLDMNADLRTFCKATGRTYPCIGTFIGMRGYDGKVLWKIPTRAGALLSNCEDFDINLDGNTDCVIGGRSATMEAIDVRNGKRIWEARSPFFSNTWNFYHPMALPDFNGDGVKEIAVMHGGNPTKESNDHDRESGRLILLDGRTGEGMGVRYLEMPNSKESYQSPVMYTYNDGSQYILFGSGGETIPGDFMMVSLPDFYRYVMGISKDAKVPQVRGSYDQWSHLHRHPDTGIIVLFTGVMKGVMVPPLMTDIDRDGIDDIVMSAYDGLVMLLDGKTMKSKWKAEFPGMESYSTPAPGFFDDDDVLDFMVHWSMGAWPMYNSSQKVILSGKDGSIIWRADLRNFEMSSDLTIQTTEAHRDIFMYKMKGRGAHVYQDVTGEIHGVGVQRNISKLPDDVSFEYKDFMKYHFRCKAGVDIKSEVFMMDRSTADTPIKIMETSPMEYEYHPRINWKDDVRNESVTYCAVLIPEDRTTSAIGDVDGDGDLDLMTLIGHTGQMVDEHYSYDRMIYKTTIHKINLRPVLQNGEFRSPIKMQTTLPLDRYRQEKDVSLLQPLPLQQQQWLTYFGTKQNGHFKNKR